MKFRKKPVEIEAVQWMGSNTVEISKFVGESLDNISSPPYTGILIIETLEGDMKASKGDWIIRGVKGEFYPVRGDIFAETYEKIQDSGIKDD